LSNTNAAKLFQNAIQGSAVPSSYNSPTMNIGILGTGTVGETIATALIKQGHHVLMGSRRAGSEKQEPGQKRPAKKIRDLAITSPSWASSEGCLSPY
jgi:lactate dehydrogenase-like 2-hydroxyacid dehydrogenase